MLKPGVIPDKEPLLRVGIILPEDEYKSISIVLPPDVSYQMECGAEKFPLIQKEISFQITKKGITASTDSLDIKDPKQVVLYPEKQSEQLAPGQGTIIKNVISGRGFHWNKQINVKLPGTIIIRKHENNLILINELPLEHYLMCVATSEMGAACPLALIEAQTIAARSWMLANVEQKHRSLDMDVCNDDCCQRYQGSTFLSEQSIKGALNTAGQVLMYDNTICDARYSKSCGGVMESFENIWGGQTLPYLQIKADSDEQPMELIQPLSDEDNFKRWVKSQPVTFCSPWTIPEKDLKQYLGSVDDEGTYFRWEETISQEEITANINKFHSVNAVKINSMAALKRGGSGRILRMIIDYVNENDENKFLLLKSEYTVRQSLHEKFLYSSAFIVIPEMGEQDVPVGFTLLGAGWGHGVGLCQIGALGMALKEFNAQEIVAHYYPGSTLTKIY